MLGPCQGGAGSRASEALKLQANEDFVTSFQDLLPQFENSIVHDDLFLLADVWASRDGEAACQWLAALTLEDERNPYLFSALSQWARQHPQAAVAWFQGQEFAGDQSQDYLIAGLIRGLAASDPAAALDALLAVPESPERSTSSFGLGHGTGFPPLFRKSPTSPPPSQPCGKEHSRSSRAHSLRNRCSQREETC